MDWKHFDIREFLSTKWRNKKHRIVKNFQALFLRAVQTPPICIFNRGQPTKLIYARGQNEIYNGMPTENMEADL